MNTHPIKQSSDSTDSERGKSAWRSPPYASKCCGLMAIHPQVLQKRLSHQMKYCLTAVYYGALRSVDHYQQIKCQ